MEPFAPFTGVLVLPDRAVFGRTSPVMLGTDEQVARIQWHNWTARDRFDILDAAGSRVLAGGSRVGFWGRSYQLLGLRQEPVLDVKVSGWGLAGRSTVTLPGGRTLSAHGNWSARKFTPVDQTGALVGRLVTTSSAFSFRPDSLAFEVRTGTVDRPGNRARPVHARPRRGPAQVHRGRHRLSAPPCTCGRVGRAGI